ncbi:Leucine-rich repeat receptor-like protein kinase [Musa troglodytarum]|uniref:Leucine-rich repeat receptor-like protein kinase n=1 Tax=Musa troglodytarum TaxID=320322 RepID=A0A9E7EV79_9LILI|nr:Leucine-rich repeat receptor-like protein kinase [Musa troglodytarum]
MLKEITLSNNRLNGSIPEEIGKLSLLQTLDLSHNDIGGSLPVTICNLSSLVELSLEGNKIDGHIPDNIDGLKNLSMLSLKRNRLSGAIPATLGNISGLSQLDLSENNLAGDIPATLVHLTGLTSFDVSDNNLSGRVPLLLAHKFNSSSFMGNIQLCGYSIAVPCPSSPAPTAALAVLLFLLCCVLLCCLTRKRSSSGKKTDGGAPATGREEKPGGPATGAEAESGGEAGGKLVHFEGPSAFAADDLLCATAEIMGKSTYGTVYKATLEAGNQVREETAREDHQEPKGIRDGGVRAWQNPASQSIGAASLLFRPQRREASARGPETPIDWATRMRIAKGVTRGLLHLHNEVNMIHGNLTNSNILLDDDTNAKISDFGLSSLMTSAASSNVIATAGALGYRAPELSKLKKANTKTDAYSLGVVMLELLTGKSPAEVTNGMDLPHWVASIVKGVDQ